MTINKIYLDEGWEYINYGIEKIKKILKGDLPFSPDDEPLNSEEYILLYTTIYSMCTLRPPHDCCQQLYDTYEEAFKEYNNSIVFPSLREKHNEFLLREFVKRWAGHELMVKWLSGLFCYLDRYFVTRNFLPELNEVGLTYFLDLIYKKLKDKLRDAVIALINQEREGDQIDRALLKNVLDIYVKIGMELEYYEKDFEDSMLKDTAAYYSRKASNWIVEYSCSGYMLKAEECLQKEKDIVSHYLHSSSETKLLEIVQNELLVVYTNQLLLNERSGCQALLRDNNVPELSRICRLFHKVPNGLELVANMFEQHVFSEGMVLVLQAEDYARNKVESFGTLQELEKLYPDFVKKMFALKDKYMAYVTGCFAKSKLFGRALENAFDVLWMKVDAGYSSAKLLASYCDNILKKGRSEDLSDDVFEETSDKVVNHLRHICVEDFELIYRNKLARRLIFDESASDDHERLILTKLMEMYGKPLVSRMERMMTELALPKETQDYLFQKYLGERPAGTAIPGFDFNVTLLRAWIWPRYRSCNVRLPDEMLKCIRMYEDFYKRQTGGRAKQTWIHSLGTCQIDVKFESKTIELTVDTYQAAILLLFSNSDRLSYSQIKSRLSLANVDLIRSLHSLSCPELKILTKEPNNEIVSSDDHFEFNSKFTDTRSSLSVLLPSIAERNSVKDDGKLRRSYIDACLVKIMKEQRVYTHVLLLEQCVRNLYEKLQPTRREINVQINSLISRGYFEVDGEGFNHYRYLPEAS